MFVVENYSLKMEKAMSFKIPKMYREFIDKRPDLFRELKSWSIYQHSLGTWGGVMEVSEYDSFEDYQSWLRRIVADKDFSPILQEYYDCVVSGSLKEVIMDKAGSWASK
jgi:hypothetical protein